MVPSASPDQTAGIRGRTPGFKVGDDDDEQPPPSSSPPPPPGRSKKETSSSSSSIKKNKNPYAARGLDKFSTVLGQLEARRTRIMEKGAGGVSMVKFAYTDSDDWIPLVVRQRSDRKDDSDTPKQQPKPSSSPPPPPPAPPPAQGAEEAIAAVKGSGVIEKMNGGALRGLGVEEVREWMRRKWRGRDKSWYWGLAMVSVLFCLVMFGRALAVCCTLVWWYLVPIVRGDGWDVKENGRRSSCNTAAATERLGGRSSPLPKKKLR